MTDDAIMWLKAEARKLHSMMADPQPGLATWMMMLGNRLENISNFYQHGWDEPSQSPKKA